jgi:hypothetical protein
MFTNTTAMMEPFDCHGANTAAAWTEYQERIEQIFDANKIGASESKQRLATLWVLAGKELFRIFKTIPADAATETPTSGKYSDYEIAIIRLNKYFNPQRNTVVEQYQFCMAKQDSDETIAQYVTRLRILATYCDFESVD